MEVPLAHEVAGFVGMANRPDQSPPRVVMLECIQIVQLWESVPVIWLGRGYVAFPPFDTRADPTPPGPAPVVNAAPPASVMGSPLTIFLLFVVVGYAMNLRPLVNGFTLGLTTCKLPAPASARAATAIS